MDKTRILIVDDDDELRTQMKWALNSHYDVLLAEDRPTALTLIANEKPAVVTLDLGLPPSPGDTREGFLALADMLQVDPLLKVLVVTGQNERHNGIEAISQGAYDFFAKPVNIDELRVVVDRAIHIQELERARHEDAAQSGKEPTSFDGMIATSPQMQPVFAAIEKVAGTDVSVLIIGESGTGKELVAQAIHTRSARSTRPFVAINCGAIPENLLESELFGHEKGAFTGAHLQRQGRVEAAQGGTLFLDEIGDLPTALQVKLLRFLQDHTVERVGGRTSIHVDARVLAATNVDLTKAMASGRFREDLYYRLGVVLITVPPLRDREGDLPLLARAFLERHSKQVGKDLVFTPACLKAIDYHTWPGNVRELENRIQRAAIMCEHGRVTPKDLGLSATYSEMQGRGLSKAREAVERQMVESAIARNKGNLTRAAAELEISRPTLYELIDKLGITRK
ncbi:MAG TPA: PEP-CTERM-box response regulator transcription factor [Terriglobia bacterium]|nr:PEP-CTERM-box response regulator transcription factor [Terriglobia bacterium]